MKIQNLLQAQSCNYNLRKLIQYFDEINLKSLTEYFLSTQINMRIFQKNVQFNHFYVLCIYFKIYFFLEKRKKKREIC